MGQTPAVRVRKEMTRTNPSEIEEIDCNYPKLSKDHCKQFGCHRLDTVHVVRHEMSVFSSQNVTKPGSQKWHRWHLFLLACWPSSQACALPGAKLGFATWLTRWIKYSAAIMS